MFESEWLACTSPELLSLEFAYRFGERTLCLFAAACLRRVWDLLHHEGTRLAVEAIERRADGCACERDLVEAVVKAEAETGEGLWLLQGYWHCPCCEPEEDPETDPAPGGWLFEGVQAALKTPGWTAAAAAFHARGLVRWNAGPDAAEQEAAERQERGAQFALLRDLTGRDPRRNRLRPAWVLHKGGTLRKFARAIYDSRAFDDLPILADALEDAGCADASMLYHCRRAGPHVRGCWVIDLLLGAG
jgi:hypothetical protein